jgi:hypothetical protein
MRPWSSAATVSGVALLAHEHADARAAREPVARDVPACAFEHAVARGRERRHAAHLGAGYESDRRIRGQSEQLADPLAHDLLDDRRRRSGDVEPGVLVPCRREPVGGERGREAAADDEAEVPPARNRDEAGLRRRGQLLDDLFRVERLFLEPHAEQGAQLVGGGLREDRPLVE